MSNPERERLERLIIEAEAETAKLARRIKKAQKKLELVERDRDAYIRAEGATLLPPGSRERASLPVRNLSVFPNESGLTIRMELGGHNSRSSAVMISRDVAYRLSRRIEVVLAYYSEREAAQ